MPDIISLYNGDIQTNKAPIWKGWRDKDTGLWCIPLTDEVTNIKMQTKLLNKEETEEVFQERLSVYNLLSKAEAVTYLHAALGFPTMETLLAAMIARFLISWPGVSIISINKYFPESVTAQKGHMKHQQKGV